MSDFTKNGGKWLSAVRSHVQWEFRNGESVTWGSNDVLEPHVTIGQVEEIAAIAVDAAFPEVDKLKKEVEELRKKYLLAQIELRQNQIDLK
jgi:hypothetical protein